MEYTRIIAAFCILGFNGIAKLFILATETAHHLKKWTSSTDFLTINYGECVHLQLWSPCWKIKSTKPQLAISGTLNHKLNLLINVNSSCFYSTLKTLFEPVNSTLIMDGILKRISKSAGKGILALHRGVERTYCQRSKGDSEVNYQTWKYYPKWGFFFGRANKKDWLK